MTTEQEYIYYEELRLLFLKEEIISSSILDFDGLVLFEEMSNES